MEFYDDVTAARLPFSRREGFAPHQIRRAILLEGSGRAGRVDFVCLGVGDIDAGDPVCFWHEAFRQSEWTIGTP